MSLSLHLSANFLRINSSNPLKPITHRLFPDSPVASDLAPHEVKPSPLASSPPGRIRDSGLKYLCWQFEHINDFSNIKLNTKPPILKGLYAFEEESDILECSDKLVDLVGKMRQAGIGGVLVVPTYLELTPANVNEMLSGPNWVDPPETHLVRALKERVPDLHNHVYIVDGLHVIWLYKFCSLVTSAKDAIETKGAVPIDLPTFATMIHHFIGILALPYADIKLEAKRVLQEVAPLLETLSREQAVDGAVQAKAVERMVQRMDTIISSKKVARLRKKLFVIPSHAYADFIRLVWEPREPHAAIVPMSCLGLVVYSDGAFPPKEMVDYCKGKGIDLQNQCSFSGVLLTSTGHIVLHWRYRMKVEVRSSTIPELVGVIFGLMLSHFLGVPVNSRCDNVLAIRILGNVLQKRTLNLRIARKVCEAYPAINPLLKNILESSVARDCRLEWVRGHAGILPNELSDYLAEQAFCTSELLDLDALESAAQNLASNVPGFKLH
ncbi:hypothetical protein L0F63_003451 [Massospora cicadina]|nr:hypothetical protein L0F63_003451 [Massospora cicadina]